MSEDRARRLGPGRDRAHIVGGLNTRLPFSYFNNDEELEIKREFPQLHLKAFTMVELDFFAKFYKMTNEEVIEKLKAAGMDSCPAAAEVFAAATRERFARTRPTATAGWKWPAKSTKPV